MMLFNDINILQR